MAGLSVAPVNNPTLTVGAPNQPQLNPNAISATPGTNGFASLNGPALHAATVPAAAPAPNPQDAQIAALIAQANAANQKVYAPALDVNKIYTQAQATANSTVNPYYTKLLNDFVGQQQTALTQQQQQTASDITNLQTQLGQTTTANQTGQERAAEDAQTSEANATQAASERQTTQGTAFDTARTAEGVKLGASGLAGSGVAGRTLASDQTTQDQTEAQQAEADQQTKNATELSKARTFEDLATSSANAATTEKAGEQAANFNLTNFITGQGTALQQQQQQLEQQRQAAVATATNQARSVAVGNFINNIANPAQREAAISAYGSFL